jgi:hypothetical protein
MTTSSSAPPPGGPSAGESNAGGSRPNLQWIERNQAAAILVAFVLVVLYVSPLILVTISAIRTDGFEEPSWMFSWFAAFMKSADSTLGQVHKVLFPFLSTLSIIAFKDRLNWWVIGLGAFVLLMFMLTIGVGTMFEVPRIASAVANLGQSIDLSVVKAFFSKIQETLLTYLMLLLGVSVISEPRGK